jgi:acetoin utilization deacetylase AcuC-like enzyme
MSSPISVVTCPGHIGHAPAFEVHCGLSVSAYDQPERVASILQTLHDCPEVRLLEPVQHGMRPIYRVHDVDMVRFLESAWEEGRRRCPAGASLLFADTFSHEGLYHGRSPDHSWSGHPAARFGRFCFDTITGIGPYTYSAARSAVDTALTAAATVTTGIRLALGLCRPPGHHASHEVFGGGCYLNNAAIAAQWLRDQGVNRVAILDLDFHHGNGTQAIFYLRDDVFYASLHGDPDRSYPYFTGWTNERGAGRGEGWNLNLLLPPGVDGPGYLTLLERALETISAYQPDIVVVSLGFDTYVGDPAGDGALQTEDYTMVGSAVRRLGVPIVALLEGGYVTSDLGSNVAAWLFGATTLQDRTGM